MSAIERHCIGNLRETVRVNEGSIVQWLQKQDIASAVHTERMAFGPMQEATELEENF
jgi:hypothetical protein